MAGASFSHHAQGGGIWPDGSWHARPPAASAANQPGTRAGHRPAVLIHGIHGRLQQRSWTAEDGSARSVVEVVRDHLEEIRDETGYSVPAGVADEIASLVERLR